MERDSQGPGTYIVCALRKLTCLSSYAKSV